MSKPITLFVVVATVVTGLFIFNLQADSVSSEEAAPTQKYVTLDPSLDQFIGDFNAAAGSTRLVFIAGPSCGPCLRGLVDMNKAVGDMTRDNPDLKTFILYVPTLGAEEKHSANAVRLMEGNDIFHYWDPDGTSGLAVQEALGLRVYAWDVWLIYDDNAIWSAGNPPAPVHWEHQLGGLPRENKLDPKRFAEKVTVQLKKQAQNG